MFIIHCPSLARSSWNLESFILRSQAFILLRSTEYKSVSCLSVVYEQALSDMLRVGRPTHTVQISTRSQCAMMPTSFPSLVFLEKAGNGRRWVARRQTSSIHGKYPLLALRHKAVCQRRPCPPRQGMGNFAQADVSQLLLQNLSSLITDSSSSQS